MNAVISKISTTKSLDELFEQEYKEREHEFTEDPLVLACVLKERYERTGSFSSLEDKSVAEAVTQTHRVQAEKIRDYYTRKFFWRLFKNDLSDYRRRLCFLLENRIRKCKERDRGIYCKLPWFYDEDMNYDEIKKSANTSKECYTSSSRDKRTINLTFLKRTLSYQRKRKIERFWFKEDQQLYCIEVEANNICFELFKSIVERNPVLPLDARQTVDSLDNMWFYKLYDFTLAKE